MSTVEDIRKSLGMREPVQKASASLNAIRKGVGLAALPELEPDELPELAPRRLPVRKALTTDELARSEREIAARKARISALAEAKLALSRGRAEALREVEARFEADVERFVAKSGDDMLSHKLKMADAAEAVMKDGGIRIVVQDNPDGSKSVWAPEHAEVVDKRDLETPAENPLDAWLRESE